MRDRPAEADRYRSLIQKAVRRGHTELIFTISAFIESEGLLPASWFDARSAVITFEECWPLGGELTFTKGVPSKVAALVRVAEAHKLRDATGLGFLAYTLGRGDASVLDGSADDKPIRLLAKATIHPPDYWSWIHEQHFSVQGKTLLTNALSCRAGERPHDKAVIQAAVYLALTAPFPEISPAAAQDLPFPFWVVFDRHTGEGRRALRDVARDLHIPLPQLEWVSFYFEGSVPNAEMPSAWWQKYCDWRFRRLALDPQEAHLIWEPAKAQIIEALREEGRSLQAEIYRWKLSNRERIEALRRRVMRFNDPIAAARQDQTTLF
jgi:hypothetical protein